MKQLLPGSLTFRLSPRSMTPGDDVTPGDPVVFVWFAKADGGTTFYRLAVGCGATWRIAFDDLCDQTERLMPHGSVRRAAQRILTLAKGKTAWFEKALAQQVKAGTAGELDVTETEQEARP